MIAALSHPQIVHVPMALAVLMPLIAGGALLAWKREWFSSRIWLVAVLFQTILIGSSLAALQSGEDDEELVENVVAHRYVEEHEEAAELFTVAAGALGALMLIPLTPFGRRWRLGLASISTAGTLVVFVLGYQTGQAGGELVYTHGAAEAHRSQTPESPQTQPQEAKGNGHEHERDGDD